MDDDDDGGGGTSILVYILFSLGIYILFQCSLFLIHFALTSLMMMVYICSLDPRLVNNHHTTHIYKCENETLT